jgi:hypothetical protein
LGISDDPYLTIVATPNSPPEEVFWKRVGRVIDDVDMVRRHGMRKRSMKGDTAGLKGIFFSK